MLKAVIVSAAAFALAAIPAQAAPSRWAKIETAPDFQGWRQELQRTVDADGHAHTNHFCLVVESFTPERGSHDTKAPSQEEVAYVRWREGGKLLEWAGSDADGSILPVPGSGVLDLRTDIVPSVADLHGSTYRQTRGWLASIERHCAQSGTQATVIRKGVR